MKKILPVAAAMLSAAFFAAARPQAKPTQAASQVAINDSVPFGEAVYGSFMEMYRGGIQEKLYLHLDKPYYSAGEKIWFKGYLINAITHAPMRLSNYIYVELIDFRQRLVSRIKVKADSCGFANCIDVKPDLPQGDYCVRGYTRWMRNFDNALFFSRNIRIVNPIDDRFTVAATYGRQENGKVQATVTLHNGYHLPMAGQRFLYTLTIDGKSREYSGRTDEHGQFGISFAPPRDEGLGNTLGVAINEGTVTGAKTLSLPSFSEDFDVQFFPEGGNLIAGMLQNIAFKAIGSNGLSVDVTMKVRRESASKSGQGPGAVGSGFGSGSDGSGEETIEAASTHRGMGRFSLIAAAGMRYYAEVKSSRSETVKRFELPKSVASGCAIQTCRIRNRILCKIDLSSDVDPRRLGFVIHSRGQLIAAEEIAQASSTRAVDMAMLPAGITHICIIDKAIKQPLAERIVFAPEQEGYRCEITPDKSVYGRRQKVTVGLRLTDSDGRPVAGNLSMAVTDGRVVEADTLGDNILSYLLLSSDLRGHIEEPAWYFSGAPGAEADLDLLMMTQGWTRFDLSETLGGVVRPHDFDYEQTQSISGEIFGFFGNAAKRHALNIFCPKTRYFDIFSLGETNRFTLTDLDFPDSTTFILQAMGRSGAKQTITLKIKEETFPRTYAYIPTHYVGSTPKSVPYGFFDQARQSYYYEGGMRVVNMEGIVVQGKSAEPTKSLLYNAIPTHSLSSETLNAYSGASIYTLIGMLPGVNVSGDGSIRVRGSMGDPAIYLDNLQLNSTEELSMITTSEIASIDLVSGPGAAVFGSDSSNGVILITLKDGSEIPSTVHPLPSIAMIDNLGWKLPADFYKPKYETDDERNASKPDLRTTIDWESSIRCDSTGRATVQFYAADRDAVYNIIVEGLSDDGHIVRQVGTVRKK
ncbi:MAG: TonB-dependent receptor plug domain-containing protein [Rikenellaceae bacterium]|jgi:hypothetical protein|nr:TonB-dependent receptor plug domain-containing protein [Rikenellaceae bacterium]